MLFFNFELILIKIGFLRNFKVAPKPGESPCTIVHGLWPNFIKNGNGRIPLFIIFADAYTCPYVVFQF